MLRGCLQTVCFPFITVMYMLVTQDKFDLSIKQRATAQQVWLVKERGSSTGIRCCWCDSGGKTLDVLIVLAYTASGNGSFSTTQSTTHVDQELV